MASETEAVRFVAGQEPDAAVGVAAAEIAVGQSNATHQRRGCKPRPLHALVRRDMSTVKGSTISFGPSRQAV